MFSFKHARAAFFSIVLIIIQGATALPADNVIALRGRSSAGGSPITSATGGPFGPLQVNQLIVMPDHQGHADWIAQIQNARRSVHLAIYHLTDAAVIQALLSKAKAAGSAFDLRILVDGKSMTGGYQKALQPLVDAGIQLQGSSPAFSIMHEKAMIVDGTTAMITAINLTNTAENTRDFGIITEDPSVAREMESVFEADWINAKNGTGDTPPLSNDNLAWSPNNSHAKLIRFIDGTARTLVMQVESLSHPDIIDAFSRAAQRGVKVQVIVPMCVTGSSLFDYPALIKLQAAGVETHVMPTPSTFEQPYIHSKMMVADAESVYVGSINFSANSIDSARELGALFFNPAVATQMMQEFDKDWGRSVPPEANPVCKRAS